LTCPKGTVFAVRAVRDVSRLSWEKADGRDESPLLRQPRFGIRHRRYRNPSTSIRSLAAASAIDGKFEPATSIRALQFYGDGNLDRVPATVQRDLTRWAQEVDLSKLPKLPSRRGLAPEGRSR
jgi:hypothetical protein